MMDSSNIMRTTPFKKFIRLRVIYILDQVIYELLCNDPSFTNVECNIIIAAESYMSLKLMHDLLQDDLFDLFFVSFLVKIKYLKKSHKIHESAKYTLIFLLYCIIFVITFLSNGKKIFYYLHNKTTNV